MTRDDVLRSAARAIRADPSCLGAFLDLLVPDEMNALEIQRFVRWNCDANKPGPTIFESFEEFKKRINERVQKICKDCAHDWSNLGGHEYIEQECRKCGMSEWF